MNAGSYYCYRVKGTNLFVVDVDYNEKKVTLRNKELLDSFDEPYLCHPDRNVNLESYTSNAKRQFLCLQDLLPLLQIEMVLLTFETLIRVSPVDLFKTNESTTKKTKRKSK